MRIDAYGCELKWFLVENSRIASKNCSKIVHFSVTRTVLHTTQSMIWKLHFLIDLINILKKFFFEQYHNTYECLWLKTPISFALILIKSERLTMFSTNLVTKTVEFDMSLQCTSNVIWTIWQCIVHTTQSRIWKCTFWL